MGREASEAVGRPRRGVRWLGLAVVVVVLALGVLAGNAILKLPSKYDLDPNYSPASTAAADSDGDGISDRVEESGWVTTDGTTYRTDATKRDTDGDGLSDGDEAGSLVASRPSGYAHALKSDPLQPDTDGDGLGDADEAELALDAFDRDTDGDDLTDGREVEVVGTSPDTRDSDGDGFDDGYEDANRDRQGLDPLLVDVRVSKMSYASDFAIGFVAGDAWRKNSLAWLAGSLASGASSSIPVIGWVVGPLADARDAVASAIRSDWVGSGFSATGAVPYAGDAVATPAKAAEFVARNPQMVTAVAKAIAVLSKVPDRIKVRAARAIWHDWDELRSAGASEKVLLRLERGRTNLDSLAASIKRAGHVEGPRAPFFADGVAGEKNLESMLETKGAVTQTQVVARTTGCIAVCNLSSRRFDVVADGVAHESKVGYKLFTAEIAKQIQSDAYLIHTGVIKDARWHFYASAYNDKLGADPRVFDLLDKVGIKYTVHLPS